MFSFPRASRLLSQKDFQSVFSKPYKVTHHYLFALCRPNQLDRARLGIIVAKRLVKSAVNRNQIRRLIRESFRYHQTVVKGLDIVVLLRSASSSLLQQRLAKTILRNDIDNLWQRLVYSSIPESDLNRR